MSGPFDEKLTDEQREAAALRYIDTEDTGREVARKAAAGELTLRGEPVGVFEIAPSYAAQLGIKMRKKRTGQAATKVAEMPHRDAIEVLRRRLVSVGDAMLADLERQTAKDPAKLDPERVRQVGRVLVELGRIPAASEPAPRRQDHAAAGQRIAPTKGGPAGALLREHRQRQAEPARDDTHSTGDGGDSSAAHSSHRSNEGQQRGEPGALTSDERSAAQALLVGG